MLQQLALGNHRTGPVRKVFQDAVFHGHQRNLLLPAFHSAFDRIQLQVGYREHRRPLAFSAPDQSLGSRQKFAQIKGLGNVVIRSGIEQTYHVLFFVSCGQHQNRRGVALLAVSIQETGSIQFRQHEIEHHEVVVAGFGQVQPFLSVSGHIHGVTGVLSQCARHVFGESFFVFDHQYSQIPS